MAQNKADRSAAAKKAAATRKRNQQKGENSESGKKAAATRQGNKASENLDEAKQSAGGALAGLTGAAKSVGDAATSAGKSVANRLGTLRKGS